MKRLTQTCLLPLATTFCYCQLCGFTSKDICDFEMIQECDENDNPEEGNVLVRCKRPECIQEVDDHERLYYTVPWSQGGAGRFMLFCGDCEFRRRFLCTHKDLTANGGSGLEVSFANAPIHNVIVCFNDGRAFKMPRPAISCVGKRHLPVVSKP